MRKSFLKVLVKYALRVEVWLWKILFYWSIDKKLLVAKGVRGFDKSIKKGKFATNFFFQVNVEWSSKTS